MKTKFNIALILSMLVHRNFGLQSNIVLIITDDQDSLLNGLDPMIKTKKLLQEQGTTFTNAFATTPLCCPSRSSILTGLYQHNHNVLNNSLSGGCSNHTWQRNHEEHTFAVGLKNLGYTTFYAGKYLNKYGSRSVGGANHIPPGWDRWIGLIGNSKYYNYSLSFDGKKKKFTKQYLTTVLKSEALSFINKQTITKPFLMVIAPPSPHSPFQAEPKYRGHFKGIKVPRTIQFNFSNNTSKHWLARMVPSPLPERVVKKLDTFHAKRWATLLSVDDLVESVVNRLKKRNLLQNTYVIFTSDNGFHLGQFSFAWDKRQMYEFDIKVPLILRGPDIPRNYVTSNPVILLDIAPTFLNIGGFTDISMDGKSFLPIHKHSERLFLIEYHGEGGEGNDQLCWSKGADTSQCSVNAACKCQDARNNTYSCIRGINKRNDISYCQFKDSENLEEAYDIKKDPFQLNNIASKFTTRCKYLLKSILNDLRLCKAVSCKNNFVLKLFKKINNCYFYCVQYFLTLSYI